jgi:hypothetical protein
MKAKVIKYSILLVLGVLAACRKELPNFPDAESPVLFFQANGDGLDFRVDAGINGFAFNATSEQLFRGSLLKGIFTKPDSVLTLSFYAGDIFSELSLSDFENLNNFEFVSWNNMIIHGISEADMVNSIFTNISFSLSPNFGSSNQNFTNPGRYDLYLWATRDGIDNITLQNEVVIGYEHDYVFELQGEIVASSGILITGQILNNTSPIQRVEWTCGNNSQTTSNQNVQFSNVGSANTLIAKVTFEDGTVRTRSIGVGLENGPVVQDYVYVLEANQPVTFNKKLVLNLQLNNSNYSSLGITDFPSGAPNLTVVEHTLYTDPVTQKKAYLFKVNGLVYVKDILSSEVKTIQVESIFGLPIDF